MPHSIASQAPEQALGRIDAQAKVPSASIQDEIATL
jgi:hypothetical protein